MSLIHLFLYIFFRGSEGREGMRRRDEGEEEYEEDDDDNRSNGGL